MDGQTLADSQGSRPIVLNGAFLGSPSGIGTYSARLLEELRAGTLGRRIRTLSPPRGGSRTLWIVGQLAEELRRSRAVLFHGLANFDLPLTKPRGTRYVLTVHDLIPLEWPDSVSIGFRLQFGTWLARGLRLADAIVCPTAAVADNLRERFPSAAPVRVVPMGADRTSGARSHSAEVAGGRPYFLCLGSVEVRKNVDLLRQAFLAQAATGRSTGRHAGAELWIAGPIGFGGRPIAQGLERASGQGIRFLGPQPPRVVARLVRNALALCAPSLAEGFGLPPLEALARGVPVLASDIPAHREVLGQAAILLPPRDIEAWKSALIQLQDDSELRAQLGRLGRARATGFSWRRTALETAALYREVLGED